MVIFNSVKLTMINHCRLRLRRDRVRKWRVMGRSMYPVQKQEGRIQARF